MGFIWETWQCKEPPQKIRYKKADLGKNCGARIKIARVARYTL
jgi:hypothetical protein